MLQVYVYDLHSCPRFLSIADDFIDMMILLMSFSWYSYLFSLQLFSFEGKEVTALEDFNDEGEYVACGLHTFIPAAYNTKNIIVEPLQRKRTRMLPGTTT